MTDEKRFDGDRSDRRPVPRLRIEVARAGLKGAA